ncbi:chemotaxis protein CheW [Candidatus Manganitrophus noduliformans]|uniref:Purine-binding chemotaxis protein CheW n=1 Tax=Candidatus Manganitrophus noduliformans TaxID=2606439 RepID=A0A7X6DU42_9BACT|nr:chemotaxis protein CheW [Candidatus Manganitrophus noduliformans]NKE73442.1 purine-binding chemotaxis protein CheW [Candidatus Manganitrophus noduliformans]
MKNRKITPRRNQTTPLDWDEVRRRIKTAQSALEQRLTPTPDEQREILKIRARALAQEPGAKKAAEADLDVVAFLLADEKYGIQASYVREVYPLKDLTPLPGTPPFVLGMINLRGRILSVIDIKKFFDLPKKGLTDLNKVIIIYSDKMEFGILADGILGVRGIPLGDIQPPLPTLTGIREEYLKGVTAERIVILDAEKLLSHPAILVHEEMET